MLKRFNVKCPYCFACVSCEMAFSSNVNHQCITCQECNQPLVIQYSVEFKYKALSVVDASDPAEYAAIWSTADDTIRIANKIHQKPSNGPKVGYLDTGPQPDKNFFFAWGDSVKEHLDADPVAINKTLKQSLDDLRKYTADGVPIGYLGAEPQEEDQKEVRSLKQKTIDVCETLLKSAQAGDYYIDDIETSFVTDTEQHVSFIRHFDTPPPGQLRGRKAQDVLQSILQQVDDIDKYRFDRWSWNCSFEDTMELTIHLYHDKYK